MKFVLYWNVNDLALSSVLISPINDVEPQNGAVNRWT